MPSLPLTYAPFFAYANIVRLFDHDGQAVDASREPAYAKASIEYLLGTLDADCCIDSTKLDVIK